MPTKTRGINIPYLDIAKHQALFRLSRFLHSFVVHCYVCSYRSFVIQQQNELSTRSRSILTALLYPKTKAVITVAIRLRYDYDPSVRRIARLLPFHASKNEHVNFSS